MANTACGSFAIMEADSTLHLLLHLWKLPVKNLVGVLIKLRSKELVRLRKCSKKIDKFAEEHRFTISKMSNCNEFDLDIQIHRGLKFFRRTLWAKTVIENPYKKLSAISFSEISVAIGIADELTESLPHLIQLIQILYDLRLVCERFILEAYGQILKEELVVGALIQFKNLEIVSVYSLPWADLIAHNIIQKPMEYLILTINEENFPFPNFYDIVENKAIAKIILQEEEFDFSFETVEAVVEMLSEIPGPIHPKLRFCWHSYGGLFCLDIAGMKPLYRETNNDKGYYVIYGKALFSQFLITKYEEDADKLKVLFIEKSETELGNYLERNTKETIGNDILTYLYSSLVND